MLANIQAYVFVSTGMQLPRMAWKGNSNVCKKSVGGEKFKNSYRFLSVILKLLGC